MKVYGNHLCLLLVICRWCGGDVVVVWWRGGVVMEGWNGCRFLHSCVAFTYMTFYSNTSFNMCIYMCLYIYINIYLCIYIYIYIFSKIVYVPLKGVVMVWMWCGGAAIMKGEVQPLRCATASPPHRTTSSRHHTTGHIDIGLYRRNYS